MRTLEYAVNKKQTAAVFCFLAIAALPCSYAQDDEEAEGNLTIKHVSPLQLRVLQDIHSNHIIAPIGSFIQDEGYALEPQRHLYKVDDKSQSHDVNKDTVKVNPFKKTGMILVPTECVIQRALAKKRIKKFPESRPAASNKVNAADVDVATKCYSANNQATQPALREML